MTRISIVEAVEAKHVAQVGALLRDYLLWMRRRYGDHAKIIDAYFDRSEWESELADLPAHYGRPYGALLLARIGDMPVGCVLLRGIGEDVGEMKRLFVRPAFQNMGIACALVARLSELGLARGYKTLKLETGPLHTEAQTLYRNLGFQPAAPYREMADWLADSMLFFKADTRQLAHNSARDCRHAALAA
ncbi:MAG: GNAT family N-acetyltransferase [Micropepsaceae bacterium]